jgi:ABC-2 type transport system ATP-binding protein
LSLIDSDVVIRTRGLTKSYGSVAAVVDADMEVRRGEVFGYLGPNGAGKTTTIRVLLDHIRPTNGSATVFGMDTRANSVAIKRRVGYLPGEFSLYDSMTGEEVLTYMANLRGDVDWDYTRDLADRLDANLGRKFSQLSRGNKQKVGLIQAFMHRPELIVLDEPTGGLDPLVQQTFYDMIDEVKADGRTVFFSSHNLPEVERVCDRVAFIRGGRLIAVEDVNDIVQKAFHRFEARIADDFTAEEFQSVPGVAAVSVSGDAVTFDVIGSPDAVVKTLARHSVTKLFTHESALEDVFLAYYSEGVPDA